MTAPRKVLRNVLRSAPRKVLRNAFRGALRNAAFLATLLLVLAAGISAAPAASSSTATVPHGTVTLLSENSAIPARGEFSLAFHFTLEPGWHIYWSNPGDSGEAARLVWHLPAGLTAGNIAWPAPKRLPAPGVMDFGYTDDVVLLVPVHATGALPAGKPADLALQLKLVVCRELCIPGSAQLSLRLPVAEHAAPNPQTAKIFAAARAALPKPAPSSWKITVQPGKGQLLLNVETGKSVAQAVFFPLDEDQIDNAAPQAVEATPRGFRTHLKQSDQLTKPLKRLRGLLELPGGAYTFDSPVS